MLLRATSSGKSLFISITKLELHRQYFPFRKFSLRACHILASFITKSALRYAYFWHVRIFFRTMTLIDKFIKKTLDGMLKNRYNSYNIHNLSKIFHK